MAVATLGSPPKGKRITISTICNAKAAVAPIVVTGYVVVGGSALTSANTRWA